MKVNNIKPLSTGYIKELLKNANMEYDSVVNKALNHYLPRIFLSCPFTDELCTEQKQCIFCEKNIPKQ